MVDLSDANIDRVGTHSKFYLCLLISGNITKIDIFTVYSHLFGSTSPVVDFQYDGPTPRSKQVNPIVVGNIDSQLLIGVLCFKGEELIGTFFQGFGVFPTIQIEFILALLYRFVVIISDGELVGVELIQRLLKRYGGDEASGFNEDGNFVEGGRHLHRASAQIEGAGVVMEPGP